MPAVKVRRADAVALLEALGFKRAKKLTNERLEKRLSSLDVDASDALGDDTLDELLDTVLSAGTVKVTDDSETKAEENTGAKVAMKNAKKKTAVSKKTKKAVAASSKKTSKKKVAASSKKTSKKKAAAASKKTSKKKAAAASKKTSKKKAKKGNSRKVVGAGKPGVIAFIIDKCREKPHTHEQLDKLVQRKFPDRDAEAMARTIRRQIPRLCRDERGLTVKETDSGYLIK